MLDSICSPTVILMISWEKPLVKPMAPGSISYHICFQSTFICIFTFCIYITKYQKYIYLILLSLLDLTFASGPEGIENPFIALVASSQFVCVGAWDFWGASYWIDTLVLKNWGKYLRYCAASSSPLRGKPTQAQDVARRISGAVAGEAYAKVNTPSTHRKPLSPALHYLPFASRFPLPHFTLAVLFALSFPISYSLFVCLFPLPFCLLVCWITCCHGTR